MTLPNVDTIGTYGGALVNYQVGVVDPTCDRDAAAANKAYASIAMATYTAVRAWLSFTTSATTPTVNSSYGADAVWGSAGALNPTGSRTSAGLYVWTWPATITDELGVVGVGVVFRRAWASFEGTATAYIVNATCAANAITVGVWTTAGTATDAGGTLVVNVWAV